MDKSFFLEHKSRLRRHLKNLLGVGAAPYLPQSEGKKPHTVYYLAVDPDRIHWLQPRSV